MLVTGKMDSDTERVLSTTLTVVSMREIGSKITKKVMEFLLLKMELNMMVLLKKIG